MDVSKREYWAIGLMTGTALDGFVDIALLKTDGHKILEFGPFELFPYSPNEREILANAVSMALKWQFRGEPPAIFIDAAQTITQIYCRAIEEFIQKYQLSREEIDFVGGHGLTVLHHPPNSHEKGQTLQLLDGQFLADKIRMPVVYDFRANDMAHGGRGAPLAPIYHAALLEYAKIEAPAAILNLGGVANLTYWNHGQTIAAFDCGPANGPINELVEKHDMGSFDKNGDFAKSGEPDFDLLDKIMANPWFEEKFPKSLDRYDFGANLVDGLSLNDGCATLSVLVAMAVKRGLDLFDARVKNIIVAGGGRKNPVLMRDIAQYTKANLIDSDDIALRGDAVEAECFGFLAVRRALNLPISFPTTTGVMTPITGGKLALPQ